MMIYSVCSSDDDYEQDEVEDENENDDLILSRGLHKYNTTKLKISKHTNEHKGGVMWDELTDSRSQ